MLRDLSSPPERTALGPLAQATLNVAERWSEAARAQSIYPEGHHRVAAALEVCAQALEAARALAGTTPLQIVFTGHGMLAHDAEVAAPDEGGLAWLRERLTHAGLAGVGIGPQANGASLAAFNERLLALYARRDPVSDAASAWGQGGWTGLHLLDRRFEGVFENEDGSAPARTTAETQRTWAGKASGRTEDPVRARWVDQVLQDPSLLARLRQLTGGAGEAPDPGAAHAPDRTLSPQEVVEQLTALVGAEDRGGPRVKQVLTHLVEALEARHGGSLSPGELAAQLKNPELGRRAAWLSSVLMREDMAGEQATRVRAAPALGPRGHAGDDQVGEDAEGFLAELARLPATAVEGELERPAEALGVLLYVLTHHEDPARLPQLLPRLREHLASPDPACLAALARVLQATSQRADAGHEHEALARVLDALRSLGFLRLARTCGFLTRERIVEGFPAHFGDWLQALDLAQAADRDELLAVLRELDGERFAQEADALCAPHALGRPGLAEALLRRPLPDLAPLADVWLGRMGAEARPAVVGWLRSLRLGERAAQVLEIVQDPAQLPTELLHGLIACVRGRPLPALAEQAAVRATAEFVRAAAGREDRRARRLEALRMLGSYPLPEARSLLMDVLQRRRWLVVPLEDRHTRQVAAETLRRQGAA